MIFNIDPNAVIVFDLDDTLYKELQFLQSAYRSISRMLAPEIGHEIYGEMTLLYDQNKNVFDIIKAKYDFQKTIGELVDHYRTHTPDIELPEPSAQLLTQLTEHQMTLGLMTDGRSLTQRNKLRSLGIENVFTEVLISEEFGSEKPALENFLNFETKFSGRSFFFIGDNFEKDFITPNSLGWETIGIRDNGENIHGQ